MTRAPGLVVLTGAGVSAESGLSTFRDPDGIWQQVRIEDVATPEAFQRDPARVHAFYNARRAQLPAAQPNAAHRALAREIISPADLIEVHIAASYAVCARRDPKGLYAKAAAGNLPSFTGRDSAFEPPAAGEASLILGTETDSPEESLSQLHAFVVTRLKHP